MKKLICSLLILVTHTAYSQEQILCILEKATGFKHEKGTNNWDYSNFKIENDKFLLIRTKKNYNVKRFGDPESYECGSPSEHGFLNCTNIHGQFRVNMKSMRISLVHPYGYVVKDLAAERKGEDFNLTPYIAIGKCSSL
jgi:hypothetical protein